MRRNRRWKTSVLDLDEFAPVEGRSTRRGSRGGTAVTDLVIAFDTKPETRSRRLDFLRVSAVR